MGRRKKGNKMTVAFICSPKTCEILSGSDIKNYKRSDFVNDAVKNAIDNGYQVEEDYQIPVLSPRLSVTMDVELNQWLDEHTKLTVGKSNFINMAIERYVCK